MSESVYEIHRRKYNKYKNKYMILKSKRFYLKTDSTKVITNDNINFVPKVSITNKLLKFDFPEISIASVCYYEGPVGCTYIRFNVDKVIYYCDRRGGSVTTYASDYVRSNKNKIRGICFAGGSFLGLEAISGCVVEEWKCNGYNDFGKCDIVGATMRSGNLNINSIYPDKNLGRFAVDNLKNNSVYLGQAGAGCMAGDGFYGQGASFKIFREIKIFVLCIVNALGIIYDNDGNVLRDRWKLYDKTKDNDKVSGKNTTLTVVITDLIMDIFELEQLSIQCHTNIATVIRPFNTIDDGDVLFGVSLNSINRKYIHSFDIKEFYKLCSETTNEAVLNCF